MHKKRTAITPVHYFFFPGKADQHAEHPGNQRDWVVGAAGYSAFFAALSKETQNEVGS
ncbi:MULTISPECIES: hypothetical protein [unclassified Sporolactobacillus]|uniref:hypothetical protein n=1 Tax=unclassified Sporolactobacillus TaxID=2628533 RepID=UPI00236783E4|nr:hypothetical protein [Sporolactobacillus sp. CQH2019]MDD9149362.1 hypothetical protein [Sporolactobacillus sp. CQH2019]